MKTLCPSREENALQPEKLDKLNLYLNLKYKGLIV